MSKRVITMNHISRQDLRDNPDVLYVFGDNLLGIGIGGQAREMRGEPNAVGFATKKAPSMRPSAFLEPADADLVTAQWGTAFLRISKHIGAGGVVVFPISPLGSGLAELDARAPDLFRAVNKLKPMLEKIDELAPGGKEVDQSVG